MTGRNSTYKFFESRPDRRAANRRVTTLDKFMYDKKQGDDMRYHNITKDDMLNGDGLRVVLWVSGCNHCCEECQNPITWDPNGGIPFNQEAKKRAV